MGPAHSTVVNQTSKRMAVITFNYTELLYMTYHTLYVLEPGESALVEANPDAIGLKIGIIYDCDPSRNEMLYQRFVCKNDSTFNINEIIGDEVSFYGEPSDSIKLQSKSKVKEGDQIAFQMAVDAVNNKKLKVATKKISKEPPGESTAGKKSTTGATGNGSTGVKKDVKKDFGIPSDYQTKKSETAQKQQPQAQMGMPIPPQPSHDTQPLPPTTTDRSSTSALVTNNNNPAATSTPADGKKKKKKKVITEENSDTQSVTSTATATAAMNGNTLTSPDKSSKNDNLFFDTKLTDFSSISSSLQAMKLKAKNKLESIPMSAGNAFGNVTATLGLTTKKEESANATNSQLNSSNSNSNNSDAINITTASGNGNDRDNSKYNNDANEAEDAFANELNRLKGIESKRKSMQDQHQSIETPTKQINNNCSSSSNTNRDSNSTTVNNNDEGDDSGVFSGAKKFFTAGINVVQGKPAVATTAKTSLLDTNSNSSSNSSSNSRSNNNNKSSNHVVDEDDGRDKIVVINTEGYLVPQLRRRPPPPTATQSKSNTPAKTGNSANRGADGDSVVKVEEVSSSGCLFGCGGRKTKDVDDNRPEDVLPSASRSSFLPDLPEEVAAPTAAATKAKSRCIIV